MNADNGTANEQTPKKTTRSRVIQACIPCHRSKRKCSRRKPCSQCLKRRITGNCIYEAIAAEDLSALEDSSTPASRENQILRSRVAELEAVIADLREHTREHNHTSVRRRKRRNSEPVIDHDGVYYGQSLYLSGSAAPELLHRMVSLAPAGEPDLVFAFSGGSDHKQAESMHSTNIFQTVFSSNHGVVEMQKLLLSLGIQHLKSLLDAFLDTVDPIHHYVPVRWIRERFEASVNDSIALQAQQLALVFSVLGLGDLVSTSKCPNVLMAGAVHLLRVANFLTSPSVDIICTFCFVAIYLQHEGRLNEYWPLLGMVIRLAQAMGLHRDPKLIENLSHVEGDIRRRIFHALAAHETALSIMFGRPNGMGFHDCELPRDISDEELYNEKSIEELPYPFEISFNHRTWQLMELTRELLETSYDHNLASYLSKANAMETKLTKVDEVAQKFRTAFQIRYEY